MRNIIDTAIILLAFVAGAAFVLVSDSPLSAQADTLDLTRSDIVKLIATVDQDGLVLSGLNLAGLDISWLGLHQVDFANTNLEGANLTGADLSEADLSQTNLRNARLINADLSGAAFISTDFKNADVSNVRIDSFAAFYDVTLPDGVTTHDLRKLREFINSN